MIPYVGCEYAREHLDALVDGELSVDEQVAVQSHLRWCRTCAARVEDLQAIGDSLRLGSLAAQTDEEDASSVSAVHDSVLIRIRAEEELSFASRFREMFTDMRLLWPALGSTLAVTIGLGLALSVLQRTSLEATGSLATMIDTLGNPGGDRNPLMPGNRARVDRLTGIYVDSDRAGGISVPRALDDGAVFEGIPEQDATYALALATVVSSKGRIANVELLTSQRTGQVAAGAGGVRANDVEMVMDAVRQSRFAPAQTPVGRAVAVNMVWLIESIRVSPAAAPAPRIQRVDPGHEAPLKRSDRLTTSTTA